jgi:hypothetical protein
MKYAVQLLDATNVLKNVADCFQGDSARIRKLGDGWFLESSAFDACTAAHEVYPIADEILRLIHRVFALYMQLFSPLEIGYVQAFSKTGVPVNRALRSSTRFNVYSSHEELQNSHGKQSFGAAVVGRAMVNTNVHESLALVGESDLQWPQVYNILEFLVSADASVRKKWSARKIRDCKQTANHYRHLGNPEKYRLPANPPSILEARSLVLDLLRRWISSQI